jgi:hypothetical protein
VKYKAGWKTTYSYAVSFDAETPEIASKTLDAIKKKYDQLVEDDDDDQDLTDPIEVKYDGKKLKVVVDFDTESQYPETAFCDPVVTGLKLVK